MGPSTRVADPGQRLHAGGRAATQGSTGRGRRAGAAGGCAGGRAAAGLALAATVVLGAAALGCQRGLDMAEAYDQRRAATTIRYSGVREETRIYPDYGSIDRRILRGPAAGGSGDGRGATAAAGTRP